MAERKRDNMPKRNKKNFRPTSKGAGMTKAGVAAYRRKTPALSYRLLLLARSSAEARPLRGASLFAPDLLVK